MHHHALQSPVWSSIAYLCSSRQAPGISEFSLAEAEKVRHNIGCNAYFKETEMSENPQDNESLSDAFHKLGVNLIETLRSAWDTPERKKLQQEVEESLISLSVTVKNELDTFNESPTGQRLKADVEDLRQRVRSGETETQVRQEILKAIQLVNTELEKASARIRRTEEHDTTPEPPSSPES
jgi:hypothetical protein